MISEDLERVLQKVHADARAQGYEFIGLEHLLLTMINESTEIQALLLDLGVDIPHLIKDLHGYVAENTPIVLEIEASVDPMPTVGFQEVLQQAMIYAQSIDGRQVSTVDVLAAMMNEKDSHAVYFLELQRVSRAKVLEYLAHGKLTSVEQEAGHDTQSEEEGENSKSPREALDAYTVNLNHEAKLGNIDPLIGRQAEIDRLVQVLCRRRKNNPLLVGEAGVGKTALAEGLARRIVHGEVPAELAEATVYMLDMGALLAGTKYRGDFEARMKAVIKALAQQAHAVLFIDEIHTIIGAGSASGGTMDASNLLKPALAKSGLRCIGATTYQEYRTIFEKDHALARRFQKIDVVEPSIDETVQILRGLKPSFEHYHHVRYTEAALTAAAELSAKHLHERFLPDKAIDVIDEAGAAQKILPKSKQRKVIGQSQIEAVIAKMARIPEKNVSHDDKQILRTLDTELKKRVYGQDTAIDVLVGAVKMSRSGLGQPEKPIGSFLFTGPTGVGKTEVAKQLAALLGVTLQRFDMSEYMESHAVSRLIGAPPGYVGFEQGGLLTQAMNKHPHCVLLLDEMEKAHPDIFNVLLQVMDYGKLTDNNGKSADFRHAVIIMTSNVGARCLSRQQIGFTNRHGSGDETAELNKAFSPEFRNRLDAVVSFAPLSGAVITKVVDKFLTELAAQLRAKNVTAEFTPALRRYLADKGFDPLMGARPMHRLIQDKLRRALADELLFGKLADGGTVKLDWDDKNQRVCMTCRKAAAMA